MNPLDKRAVSNKLPQRPMELSLLHDEELSGIAAMLLGWTTRKVKSEWMRHLTLTFYIRPDGQEQASPPPDYCNNLDAALTLCDALALKGYVVRIDNGLDRTWECTFQELKQRTLLEYYVPHARLARAICSAFVMTMDANSVEKGNEKQ